MNYLPRALAALLLAGLLGLSHAAEPSAGQTMAVTFDDLPFAHINRYDDQRIAGQTTRLLDALTRAGVKAVGFVNEHKLYRRGQLDPVRVALLQQWLDAGMELGNHTYSHLSLTSAGTTDYETDILRGERVTRELMERHGEKLRYFRHPFLQVGKTLQQRRDVQSFLQQHGYTVAPVTILSQEWMYAAAYDNALCKDDQELASRVGRSYLEHMQQAIAFAERLAKERFGHNIPQVLLLHANMLNAEYFPQLADLIRRRGYHFATLGAVLQDKAYRSLDTYAGATGESWLNHWLVSVGMSPPTPPSSPNFVRALAGTIGHRGY